MGKPSGRGWAPTLPTQDVLEVTFLDETVVLARVPQAPGTTSHTGRPLSATYTGEGFAVMFTVVMDRAKQRRMAITVHHAEGWPSYPFLGALAKLVAPDRVRWHIPLASTVELAKAHVSGKGYAVMLVQGNEGG